MGAEPLPRRLDEVTPEWLTRLLGQRWPGIVVQSFDEIECKNSHTTKLRVRLRLNDVGMAAGIPEQVCLKANWSGMKTGEITEREARFYGLMRDSLDCPIPHSYFADWDTDGSGNGIVMMEDLAVSPGRFGASSDRGRTLLGVRHARADAPCARRVVGVGGGADRPALPGARRRPPGQQLPAR